MPWRVSSFHFLSLHRLASLRKFSSSLGTGQVFVPESGSCLRGPEHSGGILETETQVRGMDAELPYCGSDLVKIPCGRGGPLCIAGVDPMLPLVLPLSPCLSGDRCASAPLAGHEAICFTSGQAHPSSAAQGEDMQTPPSPNSPILAFPDVVLGVGFPPGGRPVGDSGQEKPAMSASGQDLAPTSRDLEVVGMADHRPPLALDLSDGVHETIDSARALSTRKLYSSK